MSTTIPNEGADEEIDSLEADAPGRKPAFEEGMDQAVNRRGFLLRGALGVLGAAIGGKALSTPAHTVDHGRSGVHDEAMDLDEIQEPGEMGRRWLQIHHLLC